MKYRSVIAACCGLAAALLLVGPSLGATSEVYRILNLFGDVFEGFRSNYVDPPNENKLIESAVKGMMSSLDSSSSYISPVEFNKMKQGGADYGMIELELKHEVKVVGAIEGSAATRAGMRRGDSITHIDGQSVTGPALETIVEKLKGAIGSAVVVRVTRNGVNEPIDFSIVRQGVQASAVLDRDGLPVVGCLEGNDIGYLRIRDLNGGRDAALRDEIPSLKQRVLPGRLKGYILDLRDNPGGLLDAAVKVADLFLNDGVILATAGRVADGDRKFVASKGDLVDSMPLMILINGQTAGGAEVIAGALKDHGRAKLVGSRSYGRGTIQTILPLGAENGALRLTTARMLRPSGEPIQGAGVSPDVVVNGGAGRIEDLGLKTALKLLRN